MSKEAEVVDLTNENVDGDKEEDVVEGISKEKSKEAKGVDSVSDNVVEKGALSADKLEAAFGSIGAIKETAAPVAVKIVLKEEDVRMLIEECELSKEAAEHLLRRSDGDLKAAMLLYIKEQ